LDITERQFAESALLESELKFRQFAENIREVFYMLPGDFSTHIYVSPAYEEIWGQSLEDLYQNPDAWMEAIHPDDRELVAQEMSSLVGKAHYDGEFRIIRPDSQIRWIHSRNFPVKNEFGQITRIVGIAEDITERKIAQLQLQESETRLRILIENLPLSFWARDQDGKLVLQNRLNMLFYGNQIGTTPEGNNLPPGRLARWRRMLKRADQGEILRVESQELINGELKTLLRVTMATPTGTAGIKYMGVALDITESKRAELALKAKTEELDRFFSVSLELLCIAHTDGYFLRLNCRWETVLGYHLEELENQPFLDLVHPEDRERTLDALEQLSRQEEITSFVNRYRCRDGSYRWLEWAAYPVGQLIYAAARDITDRYEAELRLKESEARLRLFIDSLPFPVWARDANRELVLQNVADQELFGAIVGTQIYDSLLPKDISEQWSEMMDQADLGQTVVHECEEWIQSESRTFLRITLSMSEVEQGIRYIGSAIDISSRKQMEMALRRSEALLAQSQKMAHVGSFEWDITTLEIIWSEEIFYIFGLDPTTVIPSYIHFLERIYSDDLPSFISQLEDAIKEGNPFQKDYRITTPEGLIRYVEIRGECIFDSQGNAIRLLGTVHDITERKITEQSLRILQQAVDSSLNGILIVDARLPDMPITYVNPAVERLTGYGASEMYGKNCRFFQNQDRDQEGINELHQAIQKSEHCRAVIRNYRKDGTLFWNDLTISPIFNDLGILTHYVGIQNDVTKQKLLELHKDEFLAIVSHELRTPLTSIQGLLGLLSTGRLGELSEFGLKLLTNAAEDTRRLNRLVEEILDLESLRIGGVKMKCQPIQVQAILDRLIPLMQPLVNDASIQIQLQVHVQTVWADPDRILQVLTNLVGNAIKFAALGGEIQVAVTEYNSGSLWMVRDFGKGIPADKLEHIFEPFRQVDSSSTRTQSGTGLGLAICRQIIEAHGGQIWATSSMRGTTFFFALPETPADASRMDS
jgi:PAS domain S-box-containing protein